MSETRFILITVPPPAVAEAIQALRQPVCKRYNADWALRYPPHVTLRTGLIVPREKQSHVFAAFTEIAARHSPFVIRTETAAWDRMAYEGEEHFFLYLPVITDTSLSTLNRDLLAYRAYRKSDKDTFNPHVTLFWGDLPDADRHHLETDIRTGAPPWGQSFSWRCESFAFYAWQGKRWEPAEVFRFAGRNLPPARERHFCRKVDY